MFFAIRPTEEWDESETRVLFARMGVEDYRADFGDYPPVEEGLRSLLRSPPAEREGPRNRADRYLESEEGIVDSWGRPIGFAISREGCLVYSFGADGVPGGLRDDADIIRTCIDKRPSEKVAGLHPSAR